MYASIITAILLTLVVAEREKEVKATGTEKQKGMELRKFSKSPQILPLICNIATEASLIHTFPEI